MADTLWNPHDYRVCPVCGHDKAIVCARISYDHGNEVEEIWERVMCGQCRQIRQCPSLYVKHDGRPV